MRHEITIPDAFKGDEPATIVWDDVEGTVSGSHSAVRELRDVFRQGSLVLCGAPGSCVMRDPAHRPEDFVRALQWMPGASMRVVLEDLPEPLRSVEPTPWDIPDLPPGAIA